MYNIIVPSMQSNAIVEISMDVDKKHIGNLVFRITIF